MANFFDRFKGKRTLNQQNLENVSKPEDDNGDELEEKQPPVDYFELADRNRQVSHQRVRFTNFTAEERRDFVERGKKGGFVPSLSITEVQSLTKGEFKNLVTQEIETIIERERESEKTEAEIREIQSFFKEFLLSWKLFSNLYVPDDMKKAHKKANDMIFFYLFGEISRQKFLENIEKLGMKVYLRLMLGRVNSNIDLGAGADDSAMDLDKLYPDGEDYMPIFDNNSAYGRQDAIYQKFLERNKTEVIISPSDESDDAGDLVKAAVIAAMEPDSPEQTGTAAVSDESNDDSEEEDDDDSYVPEVITRSEGPYSEFDLDEIEVEGEEPKRLGTDYFPLGIPIDFNTMTTWTRRKNNREIPVSSQEKIVDISLAKLIPLSVDSEDNVNEESAKITKILRLWSLLLDKYRKIDHINNKLRAEASDITTRRDFYYGMILGELKKMNEMMILWMGGEINVLQVLDEISDITSRVEGMMKSSTNDSDKSAFLSIHEDLVAIYKVFHDVEVPTEDFSKLNLKPDIDVFDNFIQRQLGIDNS